MKLLCLCLLVWPFSVCETNDEDSVDQNITASVETEAVKGDTEADAADDAAFWYNRETPSKSLVLGTDKKSGVNLYDLEGKKLRGYDVGPINNIDVRQDVFESVDLVGASNRETVAMDFWQVKKDSLSLEKVGSIPSKLPDIYGFCLGTSIKSKDVFAFANSKTGKVEQWRLSFDDGKIVGELVRELQLPGQVEGMVADDQLGQLYVGVEEAGVYRFGIEASAAVAGELLSDSTDANSNIDYDIEGLTIFEQANGSGFLIASIQGNNSFAVFHRNGKNAYIGSFEISDGSVDGVQETDGIEAVNLQLGERFPKGIFICQDGINFDDDKKMAQNFKYVSWELIARKLDLK